MSYNKDGWAKECVTLETSGPRDYVKWRWLGQGIVPSPLYTVPWPTRL